MAGVWIISENREQALELLHIGRELAMKTGTGVSLFLSQDSEQARCYIEHGADEILILPPLAGDQSMDAYIPTIIEEAKKNNPDLILIPATARGKDIAARIASRLDTGLCSSCMSITFDEASNTLVMERLAYGGAAVQKVICTTRPVMATIPPRTYEPAVEEKGRQGQIRELPAPLSSPVKVLEKKVKERAAKDITEARVIVCVGRGIDKKEDLSLAVQLAEVLGGEIACTRPIAEEYHWLPEELCIGLSGVQVKPDLYLGIGVSGQVQHITGIRSAKVIAAVNKDENAPIFKSADSGIVGNLYDVVPKLIAELKK
ncbi:MAG TPA: electron transfer flavoprotein subunit alpha/FixB family protein [Syntrophales bacterium]|nr:electron transfer flavoprotein subunit alpha/FixB family protein [Syntrophales bacterium]